MKHTVYAPKKYSVTSVGLRYKPEMKRFKSFVKFADGYIEDAEHIFHADPKIGMHAAYITSRGVYVVGRYLNEIVIEDGKKVA